MAKFTGVKKNSKVVKDKIVPEVILEKVVPKVIQVEAVDKKVKVYGLCTKSYNIGGNEINVVKDVSFMLPIQLLPLLEGLKVVKKI